MKILFILLIALVILIGVVYCIGLLLPANVTATRTAVISARPEVVFELVTNNSQAMQWRADLTDLKIINNFDNQEKWIEYPKKGNPITFTVRLKEFPSTYEIDVTDNKIFKGYWVGSFEQYQNGTKVIFTENAIITNPFYRVFSYLFFDLGKTIDGYLGLVSNVLEKK